MVDSHFIPWPESSRPMGVGLMVPITEGGHFGDDPRFEDVIAIAETARDSGFDALWFADHFSFTGESGDIRGAWEVFTIMAAVAAVVPDVQIGVLVASTGYRNPGLLAKMAESIDEISDGRFVLGLGAGWHEPEYIQFGMPFDHRVSRFEDAISIIHQLLRTGRANHDGTFYRAHNAVNAPRGPRPAGAPILVGSNGNRMLHSAARYADAWNTAWHKSTEPVIPQVARLNQICEDVGRDPSTIAKTVGCNFRMEPSLGRRPDPLVGDNTERARLMREFRDLGFVHLIAGLDLCTPATVRDFAGALDLLDQ